MTYAGGDQVRLVELHVPGGDQVRLAELHVPGGDQEVTNTELCKRQEVTGGGKSLSDSFDSTCLTAYGGNALFLEAANTELFKCQEVANGGVDSTCSTAYWDNA